MVKSIDSRKIPPLKPLKGFEAAARQQSIRGAADELNVTHPAVSHQIRLLEDYLGVSLFVQQGRNVVLSQEGEAFYPFVRDALIKLTEGVETVQTLRASKPLRVQSYVTASIRWLAKRLPHFEAAHPNIDLRLMTCAADWEFDEDNADIGVIYCNKRPATRLTWLPLFKYQLFPVCSPALIVDYSPALRPQDLLNLPLITVYTEVGYWQQWFLSAGIEFISQKASIVVDTLAMALEMALDGKGVALINGPFVDHDIAAKRLVRPVQHQTSLPGYWGIIYRREIENEYRVQTFVNWLKQDSQQMMGTSDGFI